MTTATSFKFNEFTLNKIDELKGKIGATSNTEVLRRAIDLYSIYIDHVSNGDKLLFRNKNNKESIIILL